MMPEQFKSAHAGPNSQEVQIGIEVSTNVKFNLPLQKKIDAALRAVIGEECFVIYLREEAQLYGNK